ncbi:MAG: hypothetical protein AMXMBFR33_31300 [Candidatus Xenobia bacterium]
MLDKSQRMGEQSMDPVQIVEQVPKAEPAAPEPNANLVGHCVNLTGTSNGNVASEFSSEDWLEWASQLA